ncbi:hypothetical protein FWH13_03090 [Candidatus Saccharibacteria bacterium]|nr:hypothetical protein [Candidatus Saccharibacteria bacterium]
MISAETVAKEELGAFATVISGYLHPGSTRGLIDLSSGSYIWSPNPYSSTDTVNRTRVLANEFQPSMTASTYKFHGFSLRCVYP